MSKLNYEYNNNNNGFMKEYAKKNPNRTGDTNNKSNLNYVYIQSDSPIPFNLNSVSSNTYSSYDSKTSNVSSSNESSVLNSSYQSNPNDEITDLKYKPGFNNNNKNYMDQRYSSYTPEVPKNNTGQKRLVKTKNNNSENSKMNDVLLRNKILNSYKPSFNVFNPKRHSVNIDNYSSIPKSNLTNSPLASSDIKASNEKLLSYEYYSNSNYDKSNPKNKNEKNTESTYGSLSGSISKDRKAKSINNVSNNTDYKIIAGNLDSSKADSFENNPSQNESPLYKKIMSKLSEIPDSVLMRNSSPLEATSYLPNSLNYDNSKQLKTPLNTSTNNQINDLNKKEKHLKQKVNVIKKQSAQLSCLKPVENQKFGSLVDINSQEKNSDNMSDRLSNKENIRSKHKSMYFGENFPSENFKLSEDRRSEEINCNGKIYSQAGDLIYSSLPYYSSSLPKKTLNPTYNLNDYLYSEEVDKLKDESSLHDEKIEQSKNEIVDKLDRKGNLFSNFLNKNSVEESSNSSHTTTLSRDSGIVTQRHGINAYIKLIDSKNESKVNDINLKRLANLDDVGVIGSEKRKNSSIKDLDSSYQSNNNSILKESNFSDFIHSNLDETTNNTSHSFKSNHSVNIRDYIPIKNSTYQPFQIQSDFSKSDNSKRFNSNRITSAINKTVNTNEMEEIEEAAIFVQSSSSFTESLSDIDSDLKDHPIEQVGSLRKKFTKKKFIHPLPIRDSLHTAKIISNYPVHSILLKPDKPKDDFKDYILHDTPKNNTTRKRSKDLDTEISEITDKFITKSIYENISNENSSQLSKERPNIPLRKISTPPPLPHILDSKYKRNTIHSDNLFTKNENDSAYSKPISITSAIRDGKLEKPIRVNHGVPPPPPNMTKQDSYQANEKDAKSNKLENCVKRAQLIKNEHVMAKNQNKDVILKNSNKKEDKLLVSTNLPQLDKIDYVLKTNDDKLLTNILPYQDEKKSRSKRSDVRKGAKNNFYLNEYKLDESDPWPLTKDFNQNGKNFYENYARENDRRKKEGNGFLMLLPGIAIPIDTDAADSDESS
ncbi:unnamed protein product [Brachionus calyciflorus]|uniref:Uncharacterized protein n=1 Tax=Brachionus calyciflorus TaxID=104777 RepID=A0A813MGX2_9BILA|nr:unnamed protein product [Brachionus calyciflorus]